MGAYIFFFFFFFLIIFFFFFARINSKMYNNIVPLSRRKDVDNDHGSV